MGAAMSGVSMRPLTRRDVGPLRDWLASGAVASSTRRLFPRSLPSLLDWFDQLHESKGISPFALVDDSRLIGYCALRSPIYSGRELAIAIFDSRFHGAGVGTFAVSELCTFGFDTLRLHRIELGVYPANRRGIACYERCGFEHEALLRKFMYHEGRWMDVRLMALARSRWKSTRRGTDSNR
jgi:RimJ/RimL family protein N-acetyltransferase